MKTFIFESNEQISMNFFVIELLVDLNFNTHSEMLLPKKIFFMNHDFYEVIIITFRNK